eukprot:jgi/Hompol1/5985/HPOL_001252-RA
MPIKLTCPCGHRTKQSVCGSSRDKPAVQPRPMLECDDGCARRLRNEKLAEALGIDPDTPAPSASTPAFSDALLRSALSFRDVVITTEKTLADLVNSPSKLYHYFPKQKFNAANSLIVELATCYGFRAQLVDANVGKGTVIVRRITGHPPIIPAKLLSQAVLEYDPVTSAAAAAAAAAAVPDPAVLELEPFSPNAIMVYGVPLDAEISNIKAILKPICNLMNLAAKLYWVSDTDFLITYERFAVWGSIKEKDAEVPSLLADRVSATLVDDIGWAHTVVECQVLPSKLIRFANGDLLKRDVANLVKRSTVVHEEGWTNVKQSKNPGIPINDDFLVPYGMQRNPGDASTSSHADAEKSHAARRQWFDDEAE